MARSIPSAVTGGAGRYAVAHVLAGGYRCRMRRRAGGGVAALLVARWASVGR